MERQVFFDFYWVCCSFSDRFFDVDWFLLGFRLSPIGFYALVSQMHFMAKQVGEVWALYFCMILCASSLSSLFLYDSLCLFKVDDLICSYAVSLGCSYGCSYELFVLKSEIKWRMERVSPSLVSLKMGKRKWGESHPSFVSATIWASFGFILVCISVYRKVRWEIIFGRICVRLIDRAALSLDNRC